MFWKVDQLLDQIGDDEDFVPLGSDEDDFVVLNTCDLDIIRAPHFELRDAIRYLQQSNYFLPHTTIIDVSQIPVTNLDVALSTFLRHPRCPHNIRLSTNLEPPRARLIANLLADPRCDKNLSVILSGSDQLYSKYLASSRMGSKSLQENLQRMEQCVQECMALISESLKICPFRRGMTVVFQNFKISLQQLGIIAQALATKRCPEGLTFCFFNPPESNDNPQTWQPIVDIVARRLYPAGFSMKFANMKDAFDILNQTPLAVEGVPFRLPYHMMSLPCDPKMNQQLKNRVRLINRAADRASRPGALLQMLSKYI